MSRLELPLNTLSTYYLCRWVTSANIPECAVTPKESVLQKNQLLADGFIPSNLIDLVLQTQVIYLLADPTL